MNSNAETSILAISTSHSLSCADVLDSGSGVSVNDDVEWVRLDFSVKVVTMAISHPLKFADLFTSADHLLVLLHSAKTQKLQLRSFSFFKIAFFFPFERHS